MSITPYKYYFKSHGTNVFREQPLLDEITNVIEHSYNMEMLNMTSKERYINTLRFVLLKSNSLIKTIGNQIPDMSCGEHLHVNYILRCYNENPALIVIKNNNLIGILTFTYGDANIITIDTICSKERGMGTKILNYFMNVVRLAIHNLRINGNTRYVRKIALQAISDPATMKFYTKFNFKYKNIGQVQEAKTHKETPTLIEMDHSNRSKSLSPTVGATRKKSKSKSASPTSPVIGVFNLSAITKQTFDTKIQRLIGILQEDIELNKEIGSKFTVDDLREGLIPADIKFTDSEKEKAVKELNKLLESM